MTHSFTTRLTAFTPTAAIVMVSWLPTVGMTLTATGIA